jgi:hypothetical protein
MHRLNNISDKPINDFRINLHVFLVTSFFSVMALQFFKDFKNKASRPVGHTAT